jgi:hypothetical protein
MQKPNPIVWCNVVPCSPFSERSLHLAIIATDGCGCLLGKTETLEWVNDYTWTQHTNMEDDVCGADPDYGLLVWNLYCDGNHEWRLEVSDCTSPHSDVATVISAVPLFLRFELTVDGGPDACGDCNGKITVDVTE